MGLRGARLGARTMSSLVSSLARTEVLGAVEEHGVWLQAVAGRSSKDVDGVHDGGDVRDGDGRLSTSR